MISTGLHHTINSVYGDIYRAAPYCYRVHCDIYRMTPYCVWRMFKPYTVCLSGCVRGSGGLLSDLLEEERAAPLLLVVAPHSCGGLGVGEHLRDPSSWWNVLAM